MRTIQQDLKFSNLNELIDSQNRQCLALFTPCGAGQR